MTTTTLTILQGNAIDVLRGLPSESVNTCCTSPPYWGLRSYVTDGHELKPFEIGLERTIDEYVAKMVSVFAEVWRVLRDDGTCWVNLGDSYNAYNGGSGPGGGFSRGAGQDTARPHLETGYGLRSPGLKPKDLCGIPWRVAFALQAWGWWLRQDIIWHKPNPMPESVTDRCTKAHEYLFLLSKSERYWWDQEAMKETKQCFRRRGRGRSKHNANRGDNGDMAHYANKDLEMGSRNRRSVWNVPTYSYPGSHFATYPPDLIKPCILAGCPEGGTVLDPFAGSGTTGMVALECGRRAVLIELNPDYIALIRKRTHVTPGFTFAGHGASKEALR